MTQALLLSFMLGFITASPIGPIGLLCLRRTLSRGVAVGLISALGISCAYAIWSYVAIHGLATMSHWIEKERTVLEIAIGAFFFLYGIHGIFNTPDTNYRVSQGTGGIAEFMSTFLVVFLNPATLVMFSALFALFGLAKSHFGFSESVEIAAAVFLGSIAFWITVAQVIYKMRRYLEDSIYKAVSRIASHAIIVFVMAILLYSLYGHLHAVLKFGT